MLIAVCEFGLMLTVDDMAGEDCHIGQRVFGHTGVIAAQDGLYGKCYGRIISNYCVVFEDPMIHSWWLRQSQTCQDGGNLRVYNDLHTLWSNCPINTQSFSSCKTKVFWSQIYIKVILTFYITHRRQQDRMACWNAASLRSKRRNGNSRRQRSAKLWRSQWCCLLKL